MPSITVCCEPFGVALKLGFFRMDGVHNVPHGRYGYDGQPRMTLANLAKGTSVTMKMRFCPFCCTQWSKYWKWNDDFGIKIEVT